MLPDKDMKKIVFIEIVQSFGGARKSTLELAKRLSFCYNVEVWDLYGKCLPFVDACKKMDLNLKILCQRKAPIVLNSQNILMRIWKSFLFICDCIKANQVIKERLKDEKAIIIVNNSKTLSLLYRKPKKAKIVFFCQRLVYPSTNIIC